MKSCSRVPFSFSRTMALADSMIAIIWHMTTIRPGMKKLAERVSGLNRTRGRDFDRQRLVAQDPLQRFAQGDGVADVDRLGRHARLGAVHEDQDLGRVSRPAAAANSPPES